MVWKWTLIYSSRDVLQGGANKGMDVEGEVPPWLPELGPQILSAGFVETKPNSYAARNIA